MKKYPIDIFISYAHIDNRPLTPEQQGWITKFEQTFGAILSTRLGIDAKIWRDRKLSGADIFSSEIVHQLKDSALLISIISPRYIRSEWFTREVSEFCKAAESEGGIAVDRKSRIIKVIKTPVDSIDTLPPVMDKVLGYDFYIDENGNSLELDPDFGDRYREAFLLKVASLANEAAQIIKLLTLQSGEPGTTNADDRSHQNNQEVVYLAECSHDNKEAWDILKTDLNLNGYQTFPDQPLPLRDEEEFRSAVTGFLTRANLSIHLVGQTAGPIPDGLSQKPIVELQNEIAAQCSQSQDLKRLVWLPKNLHSDQERQRNFIRALQYSYNAQCGAEIVTGGLEDLKSATYRVLKKIHDSKMSSHEQAGPDEQEGNRMVYLVCVEDDKKNKSTLPLRQWLTEQGFEVRLPLFAGDAKSVRENNEELLATCDSLLIFYGAGDESWLQAVRNSHKKIKAFRGSRPLLATYTYIAQPTSIDKEDRIDVGEANLINGLNAFDPASMIPFLHDMTESTQSS
jgi:hypothetical protein